MHFHHDRGKETHRQYIPMIKYIADNYLAVAVADKL